MTNAQIARIFDAIATMLEMDGSNPFRIRAYREGARVIETLPEPAEQLALSEGRLQQVRGIGKDLEQKVRDIATRGSTDVYDELAKKYPPSLMELTELPGLGPKRVKALFQGLGIRSRTELADAARAGKLKELPGFGETVEAKVLKAIAALEVAPAVRVLLHAAWDVGHELAAAVAKVRGVEKVELAGSFRRRRETVGDLDLLVCGGERDQVMTAFTTHPYVHEVTARGDTRSAVRLGNGLQVDLRLVPLESFGAALLYFTGSKAHNIELRKIAIDKGLMLNEYGLMKDEKPIAARTEEDVYRALGLAWIPPELRESNGEIEQARNGTLPRLVELEDLRADLHMHTDRTDGRDSLAAMVRASRDKGYAYCAITDHSKSLGMTLGFDGARVRQSVDEIAAVRREVPGIEVLHGLEVDILADGRLDLEEWALELLDWVIVSLHTSLAQPREIITRRVLQAIEHPAVCAMGHPSGRKIGAREPADLDWDRVFARAAECGVAMEINGQPDRVDLSDVNARMAKSRGIRFVIDTDAHATTNLDYARYGVFQARRAGLEAGDVLNSLGFAEFETWRRGKKGAKSPPPRTLTPSAEPAPAQAASKAARKAAKSAPATPAPKPAPENPRSSKKPARSKAKAR